MLPGEFLWRGKKLVDLDLSRCPSLGEPDGAACLPTGSLTLPWHIPSLQVLAGNRILAASLNDALRESLPIMVRVQLASAVLCTVCSRVSCGSRARVDVVTPLARFTEQLAGPDFVTLRHRLCSPNCLARLARIFPLCKKISWVPEADFTSEDGSSLLPVIARTADSEAAAAEGVAGSDAEAYMAGTAVHFNIDWFG